jgi:hypothetical protein
MKGKKTISRKNMIEEKTIILHVDSWAVEFPTNILI